MQTILAILIYPFQMFRVNTSYETGCGCLWIEITARAVIARIFFALVQWLWRSVLPFGAFDYWTLKGTFGSILGDAWPIFAWGGLAFLVISSLVRRFLFPLIERLLQEDSPVTMGNPAVGIWQSIWNGIGEEVMLRWIAFFDIIVLLTGLNFLLGGFAGGGLLAWLYMYLVGPAVNFVTFGMLHSILFHQGWGWNVGASIVVVSFCHFERRFFPVIGNMSWLFFWPVGLFLFLIMFKYGLIASILVHCVYEMFLVVLILTVGRWLKPATIPAAIWNR